MSRTNKILCVLLSILCLSSALSCILDFARGFLVFGTIDLAECIMYACLLSYKLGQLPTTERNSV